MKTLLPCLLTAALSYPSFAQRLFNYSDSASLEIKLPTVMELHDKTTKIDYSSGLGGTYEGKLLFGKRKFVLTLYDSKNNVAWSTDYKLNDKRNGYFKSTKFTNTEEEYTFDRSTDEYTETTTVAFIKTGEALNVAVTIMHKKNKSKKADLYIAAGG